MTILMLNFLSFAKSTASIITLNVMNKGSTDKSSIHNTMTGGRVALIGQHSANHKRNWRSFSQSQKELKNWRVNKKKEIITELFK